ncbi:LADA_0D06414g1_1 [Lachancea dasiensis]|uniref:LADA_0D06414g1_1 n=1 Tax=Lachancea dasiensis TaxID=1072105 RepID=A0A1G4J688_9SACH|nr:LADA_0D06414g1_1 [Lachancea dasiensis]
MSSLRSASMEDLSFILEIFASAVEMLKSKDIDQWQNGYPNEEQAVIDIQGKQSYILTFNGKVAAVGTITTDRDPSYSAIDGSWAGKDGDKYASLHRIAVSEAFRGKRLGQLVLSALVEKCKELGFSDIRADTHRDNNAMRKLLSANSFEYRGIISKNNNCSMRLAYQLHLDR